MNAKQNTRAIRTDTIIFIIATIVSIGLLYFAVTGFKAHIFLSLICILISCAILYLMISLFANLVDVRKITEYISGQTEFAIADFAFAMNKSYDEAIVILKRVIGLKYFIGYIDSANEMLIMEGSSNYKVKDYVTYLDTIAKKD